MGVLDQIFMRAPGVIGQGLRGQNEGNVLKEQQDSRRRTQEIQQDQLRRQIERDAMEMAIRQAAEARQREEAGITAKWRQSMIDRNNRPAPPPPPIRGIAETLVRGGGRKRVLIDPTTGAEIRELGDAPAPMEMGGSGAKPAPAAIKKGISSNRAVLNQIDAAISSLEANPKATGIKFGIARALTPSFAEQPLVDALNPSGVDTRTIIADISSKQIHDRTGAAMSASEANWMKPFLASDSRNSENNIKALRRMRERLQLETELLEQQYAPEAMAGNPRPPTGDDADAAAAAWLAKRKTKKPNE